MTQINLISEINTLTENPSLLNTYESPKKAKDPILKLNDNAQAALYKGLAPDENKTKARVDFLYHLNKRLAFKNINQCKCSLTQRKSDPASATISIVDLLDKEGLRLYKLALEEEVNCKFMDAYLAKSVKFRPGKKFITRPILVVSGPSSSGKSRADNTAEELMDRQFTNPKDKTESGNHIIKVDGGDARELSKIREIVIKAALARGYSGVHDLHENSAVLGEAKKRLLDAALLEDRAAVNIPETFSNWFAIKSFMSRLQNIRNSRVLYTRVEGQDPDIFRDVVKRLGVARAYQGDPASKKLPESKDYEPQYFTAGKIGSELAESYFSWLNPRSRSYIIENDLIQVRKKGNLWVRFEGEEQPTDKVMVVSKRIFEKWKDGSYVNEPRKIKPAGEEKKPDDIICVKFNEQKNVHEEVEEDGQLTTMRVRRDFWDKYCEKREALIKDDQKKVIKFKAENPTVEMPNMSEQRLRDSLHISLEEFNSLYQNLPPRIYEASWYRVKTAVFKFNKLFTKSPRVTSKKIGRAVHTINDAIEDFEKNFVDQDETRLNYFNERAERIKAIKTTICSHEEQFSDEQRDALKKIIAELDYHEKKIRITSANVNDVSQDEIAACQALDQQNCDHQIKELSDAHTTLLQKHPLIHNLLTGLGMAIIAIGFIVGVTAIVIVTQGMAVLPLCAIIGSFTALMFSCLVTFAAYMEKASVPEDNQQCKNSLQDWGDADISNAIKKANYLIAAKKSPDVPEAEEFSGDVSEDENFKRQIFVSESESGSGSESEYDSDSEEENRLSASGSSSEIESDMSGGSLEPKQPEISPLLQNSLLSNRRHKDTEVPTVIHNTRPTTI